MYRIVIQNDIEDIKNSGQHLTQESWFTSSKKDGIFVKFYKDKTLLIYGTFFPNLIYKKKFVYAPNGPVINESLTKKDKKNFISLLKTKFPQYAFIRVQTEERLSPISAYFAYSDTSIVQPKHEWIVNLRELDRYEEWNGRIRYLINKALKTVRVESIEVREGLDIFLRLNQEMKKRKHITLHSDDYYEHIFDNTPKKSFFLIGKVDDKPVFAGLYVVSGDLCTYLYGASSGAKKEGVGYAVQFEGMKKAKALGCSKFSFGYLLGDLDNGVNRFKKKFPGYVSGEKVLQDVPINKLFYLVYFVYKNMRYVFSRVLTYKGKRST